MSENATNPSEQPYDPDQDPDSDPAMMKDQAPAHQGEDRRDPAEGADDSSATDDSDDD